MAEIKISIIADAKRAKAALDGVSGRVRELVKSGGGLQGLNAGLMNFNAAISAIGTVYSQVSSVVQRLVGDTMEYAAQVRDLSRATGMSAEDTSRLIQVADDMTISYEALGAAARVAAKQGITLSTDALAQMSDEYLRLQPGAERSAYLLEHFGKQGHEMGKLLEQGSQAIRDMSDSMDESMILTQSDVDAARELEIAWDNLSDMATGLQYTIGKQLIPVLTSAATATQTLITWQGSISDAYQQHEQDVFATAATYRDYQLEMIRAALAAGELHDMEARKAQALLDGAIAAEHQDDVLGSLTDALGLQSELAYNARDATTEWMDAHDGTDIEDFSAVLTGQLQPAIVDANVAMQELTTKLLYTQAAAGLDAKAALELAGAMGLVKPATLETMQQLEAIKTKYDANADGAIDAAEAASGYTTAVTQMANGVQARKTQMDDQYDMMIDDLDTAKRYAEEFKTKVEQIPDRRVTVTVAADVDERLEEFRVGVIRSKYQERAAGGPVWAGQSYLVGERGPELFLPSQSGTIVPNNITNNFSLAFSGASVSDVLRALQVIEVLHG